LLKYYVGMIKELVLLFGIITKYDLLLKFYIVVSLFYDRKI